MPGPRYRRDRFVPRRTAAGAGPRSPGDGSGPGARPSPRWRRHARGAVLAWLVLMTVWGFGRAAAPAVAGRFLVAGLVAGAVAWGVSARR